MASSPLSIKGILILSFIFSFLWPLMAQLQVGFYSSICPDAESIVSSVVRESVLDDPTMAAALLRLHYHDCFVQGCDGSILIDKPNAERLAFNHAGVRGFDVIERAKAQLEDACQGVVSCADIVALAARESIALSNGPSYEVPTGRRDGRNSNISDADNMPEIEDTVQQLRDKFMEKGLSGKDLVLLTAAHTIGTTACFFLERRLYDFLPGGGSDPSINPEFLPELQSKCPQNGDVNVRLGLDHGSDLTFDTQILHNIKDGFGVLESDAKLYDDESTKRVIDSYFGFMSSIFGPFFEGDFVDSIVKMGQIGAKTGADGEIRRVCSAFN
ncbi:peroxidase 43-like [Magnolia sinica]|uniref:peroxidase 43-like n=1 Tax=Magnolia sinica TaxID=86752 RepID=UPI002659BAFF|nr:peroxidase 43-like [Magnolia sinica]